MTSRIKRLLVAGAALAFVVPTTLLAQNPSNVQLHNINAGAVGGRWLLQPGTATSGVFTITMPNASGTLIAGTGVITNNRVARFDASGFLVSGRIVDDGTNPLQLLAQLDVNNFTLTNVAGTEVTVQDNLLINSAGANDLTIDEGGLTRVGAISINPGTGNTLSTNGSLVVNSGGAADITLAETGLSRGGNIAVNPGTGAEVTTDGLIRAAEGVRITTGGLIVTAGGADIQAGGLSALGAVNLNTSAAANTTTVGNAFAGNTLTVNSATVNMANLPAGAGTDAIITTDGTALRETTIAGLFGGAPWVVGGNT
ncbi:MAG TPA: hypothetical protein VK147_01085, partial [Candidatus Didemnitutus sp.]|nr:hypothetical protein [Candidatus Didemnitutus sp.]